jgi:RimJ/RimL family protein N-acetyltransferase
MNPELNHLSQPIGFQVIDWTIPAAPARTVIEGFLCRLEPVDPDRHTDGLWAANARDTEGRNWTYHGYGPFDSLSAYREWLGQCRESEDPQFYVIADTKTAQAVGVASYLRINPSAGSIEVGHINYSPLLQGTRAGTEAMYLMMKRVFDLGYRRYEWKCNALNAHSRRAAQRLGFSFEGVFRQALVVKGRNRDTAWYSVLDHEWPQLRTAVEQWLDANNFDELGNQKMRLSVLTRPLLKQTG